MDCHVLIACVTHDHTQHRLYANTCHAQHTSYTNTSYTTHTFTIIYNTHIHNHIQYTSHLPPGWRGSFYGDLHHYGKAGVQFYTQTKTVTANWKDEAFAPTARVPGLDRVGS